MPQWQLLRKIRFVQKENSNALTKKEIEWWPTVHEGSHQAVLQNNCKLSKQPCFWNWQFPSINWKIAGNADRIWEQTFSELNWETKVGKQNAEINFYVKEKAGDNPFKKDWVQRSQTNWGRQKLISSMGKFAINSLNARKKMMTRKTKEKRRDVNTEHG